MKHQRKRIWIAWERQRRTLELSKHFGAELFIFEGGNGSRWLKYWPLLIKTLRVLLKNKPDVLYVQNPSIFLAFYGVLLRPFFGYQLVIDRHSNFKFHARGSKSPKWLVFHCLSRFTCRHADLTIVTNKYLKHLVHNLGGRALVLPDKLPSVSLAKEIPKTMVKNDYEKSALFVCTFADDEPYIELIEAARSCANLKLFVTGRFAKALNPMQLANIPENVTLLGFVSDEDYFAYMSFVDFVIVLTTQEFTLNCGSYEALALNKPMIVSGTRSIRSYFSKCSVYVEDYSEEGVKKALQNMCVQHQALKADVKNFKEELVASWDKKCEAIERFLL